ncbi:cell division protein FtsL [Congregibacter brevis]|uniref:Cell division protein FtsL n=1 Tax=Congregibacter brevis TaxID=3081201 RepID=A0ABZ0IFX0_9GAMM|nr:cell division protein FtsL [Congregibacter sp. IMCC45268]
MNAALVKPLWAAIALALVLISAFSIIGSTHSSRSFYAQLQDLEAQRWYLEEEYSRLLLEQSTLASHYRIESEAGEALGLVAPGHDQTRLVAQ